MNSNIFLTDVESVLNIDIPAWQETFFWPISYDEFTVLENSVKRAVNSIIEEYRDSYVSDLLIVHYKIILELTNFYYSLMLIERLRERGLSPCYGSESINCRGIIETGVPLKRLLTQSVWPTYTINEQFLNTLKVYKWQLLANKSGADQYKSFCGKSNCAADFLSMLLFPRTYFRHSVHESVMMKLPAAWFDKRLLHSSTREQNDAIYAVAYTLVERSVTAVRAVYTLNVTDEQKQYVVDGIQELLRGSLPMYEALKRKMQSHRFKTLYVGWSGKPLSRMLSLAARSRGIRVASFQHGEPIVYDWDMTSWLELSTIDTYIVYTSSMASLMRKTIKRFPPLRRNTVLCESADCHYFKPYYKRGQETSVPAVIKKVMIVAKVFNKDNGIFQVAPLPGLVQFDVELRIIDILRTGGYEILYKRHPDSIFVGQTVTTLGEDVRMIGGRFEDVIDEADAFIFLDSRTSTLCSAICSQKPIIFIDGPWQPWNAEIYELFAKRCTMIPAHFDERNRVIFDEKCFMHALKETPSIPDQSYYETFMNT